MMKLNRILALCLTLALGAGLLAGCAKGDSSSSAASSTPSASSSAASSADGSTSAGAGEAVEIEPMDLTNVTDITLATAGIPGDTVVGTVGGLDITAKELIYWLNYDIGYTLQQYSMFGITEIPWDNVDNNGVTTEESILDGALQMAAYYAMISEQAARDGVSLPADIDDQLAADQASIVDQIGSEQAAERYYWLSMMELDLFEKLYKGGVLAQSLRDHHFGEGSEGYPTDAEVAAYAQDELGCYRAKHILLLTKNMEEYVYDESGNPTGYAPLDDKTIAEKKAQADSLLAKLKAAKDPVALFDNLMNEYSEDSGLAANPDGYTTYKGEMVPEFEEAALALKDGEFSEVVESDYGYHIVLRLPLDLTEHRESLVNEKMSELNFQWLDDYGIKTNENYSKIDPSDFWGKAQSLQMAAYNEVQAAFDAKNAAAGDTSSPASSQG